MFFFFWSPVTLIRIFFFLVSCNPHWKFFFFWSPVTLIGSFLIFFMFWPPSGPQGIIVLAITIREDKYFFLMEGQISYDFLFNWGSCNIFYHFPFFFFIYSLKRRKTSSNTCYCISFEGMKLFFDVNCNLRIIYKTQSISWLVRQPFPFI